MQFNACDFGVSEVDDELKVVSTPQWEIDRTRGAEDARYRAGSALHAFLRWRTVTSAAMRKH